MGRVHLKKAVVAGATGAVGRALLARLRESEQYGEIHLLLRRQICSTSPKLVQHVIDFGSLPHVAIDGPIDDVFCALGTTRKKAGSKADFRRVDHDYVVAVGELAFRLGASMAVVSSVGASPSARSFYLSVKGEAEASLIALGLSRLIILRPSLLLAHRQESRPLEELVGRLSRGLSPLMVGPLGRIRPISVGTVADRMIEALNRSNPPLEVIENEDLNGCRS